MATENLSVELTANITNFRANLAAAATELNRTGNQAQAASNQISQNIARVNAINLSGFNRSLQQGQVSLASIATVSTTASRSLAQVAAASANTGRVVSAGSNQAAFALTNLGRVAQDAPFGFIGIQNNLNPLLESFQRLRAESGSTGAALKALGQSLIGPAGIGIALSVVSSAVVLYTQYQQRANKEVKDAKKNTDEYTDSLSQLDFVQVKGAQNAQKEVTELQTLYGITQNTTLSIKQRKEAVDLLQEQYPEYLKNFSDEAILAGKASDKYKELTDSLIATARARAAMDLITKNSNKQLENEQKLVDLEKENLKAVTDLEKARQAILNAPAPTGLDIGTGLNQAKQAFKVSDSIKAIEAQRKAINEENTELTARNLRLTEAITAEIKKGADLTDDTKGEGEKSVKSLSDILKELGKNLEKTEVQLNSTFGERNEAQIKAYQTAIDSATDSFGKQSKAVQDLIAQQRKLFQLPSIADGSTNVGGLAPVNTDKVGGKEDTTFGVNMSEASLELLKEQARIIELTEKFNKDFGELAQSGIANGLGNMANAIGEAFASGESVIGAIGNSLLTTFSGFLSDFGDLLIQYGAAAVLKGKLDLAVAIPGAGIFAGLAAVAAGVALKVAAGAIGAFSSGKSSGATTSNFNDNPTPMANGAVVFGPTNALVGEYSGARNNPEVVAPLNKLKGMLGNTGSNIQVIPIANRRELAIMVREGNEELSRR